MALTIAGVLLATAAAAPAGAATGAETTTSIVVDQSTGAQRTTVTLHFDKPISSTEANKIKTSLAAEPAASASIAAPSGDLMWCGGYISDSDANSWFSIEYKCGASPRRLLWGWKLSAALQAIVVNGTLNEIGLSWWRNGVYRGQNGPHSGLWANYTIHGNINPVYRTDDVEYQDYATFRHTLGPGGSGSVS